MDDRVLGLRWTVLSTCLFSSIKIIYVFFQEFFTRFCFLNKSLFISRFDWTRMFGYGSIRLYPAGCNMTTVHWRNAGSVTMTEQLLKYGHWFLPHPHLCPANDDAGQHRLSSNRFGVVVDSSDTDWSGNDGQISICSAADGSRLGWKKGRAGGPCQAFPRTPPGHKKQDPSEGN